MNEAMIKEFSLLCGLEKYNPPEAQLERIKRNDQRLIDLVYEELVQRPGQTKKYIGESLKLPKELVDDIFDLLADQGKIQCIAYPWIYQDRRFRPIVWVCSSLMQNHRRNQIRHIIKKQGVPIEQMLDIDLLHPDTINSLKKRMNKHKTHSVKPEVA